MTETAMEVLQICIIFPAILIPTAWMLWFIAKDYEQTEKR